MGPQNVIVGNDNPTELPQTQTDDTQLKAMAKTAKFAKSAEFKELKTHFEARMDFYKQYLPDGRAVGAQPASVELANMWIVANCIVGEFNSIISAYEQAIEFVKEAKSSASANG